MADKGLLTSQDIDKLVETLIRCSEVEGEQFDLIKSDVAFAIGKMADADLLNGYQDIDKLVETLRKCSEVKEEKWCVAFAIGKMVEKRLLKGYVKNNFSVLMKLLLPLVEDRKSLTSILMAVDNLKARKSLSNFFTHLKKVSFVISNLNKRE